MKPYTLLAEYSHTDTTTYGLYERDGVKYFQVNTQPVSNSKETHCESELAQMMARPFRPARQPRFLLTGFGLGTYLNAINPHLPQQKAAYDLLDCNPKSFEWYQEHLVDDQHVIEKCEFHSEPLQKFLKPQCDVYHGIFVDPELWRGCGSQEDLTSKPMLNCFVNSLKMGGLFAMITERPDKIIQGRMERCGLEVTVERISAVPGGKRQRTIWFAKKGHYHQD